LRNGIALPRNAAPGLARAHGGAMDAIVFRLKRAHLSVQHRFLAKLLKPCALTPARFDLLFVMLESRCGGMAQAELHRALGVSRPVISRLVASLERLRFVRRWPWRRGARREVLLTPLGRQVLRHARRRFVARKFVRRTIDRITWCGESVFVSRCQLEGFLYLLANRFGDHTRLPYLWHPDD
jgi:DNA-binding MarR family transcriptional regulator